MWDGFVVKGANSKSESDDACDYRTLQVMATTSEEISVDIPGFYAGKNVLLTGSTGFLGKVWPVRKSDCGLVLKCGCR